MAKALDHIEVPAGTPPGECRACGEPIYFVDRPSGRKAPVSCSYDEQCVAPSETAPGLGINHFIDCTDPNRFHRKG